MNSDAYLQIFAGSIAGAFAGVLLMWNRTRSQRAGNRMSQRLIVLILGTTASACAFIAFTKAFAGYPRIQAVVVMILITAWAALLNSVAPLPLPQCTFKVRAAEIPILRAPWTGVRLFGALLRNTPLRHLEGRVYLAGRNPEVVITRIREAQRVHIWALVFCLPWLVAWSVQRHWTFIACALAVHVPLNIYPILHLRLITWGLERVVARHKRRIHE